MVILGIDPSASMTGAVFWETTDQKVVHWCCFAPRSPKSPTLTIARFGEMLTQWLERKPDKVAYEEAIVYRSIRASIRLAELQGIARFLCFSHKIPFHLISTTHIKKVLTGDGRADKIVVMQALQKHIPPEWRNFRQTKFEALVDALACAITLDLDIKQIALTTNDFDILK